MGKSFQIGSLAGIRIQIHWTFLAVIGWVLIGSFIGGAGILKAVQNVLFVLVLFGCVVLHELGHALAARKLGIPTRDITILPIGGVARLERMPRKASHELVVALAGPAVNLIIAAILGLVLMPWTNLSMRSLGDAEAPFLQRLFVVNVALLVFNLLPAFPMDGGRVLRALLSTFLGYVPATRVAATVGQCCAIGFAFLGLFNPMLFFIAAFIFLVAAAEARQAEMQQLLTGFQVQDLMLEDFRAIAASASVRECAPGLLRSVQRDFPVIDEDRYIGMLRRDVLLKSLDRTDISSVGDLAEHDVQSLAHDEPLADVLDRGAANASLIPVTRSGELVGLLDLRSLSDPRQIRALAHEVGRPPHRSSRSACSPRETISSHFGETSNSVIVLPTTTRARLVPSQRRFAAMLAATQRNASPRPL